MISQGQGLHSCHHQSACLTLRYLSILLFVLHLVRTGRSNEDSNEVPEREEEWKGPRGERVTRSITRVLVGLIGTSLGLQVWISIDHIVSTAEVYT